MDRRHQEQFSVEQPPPRDFPTPAVFPAQTHQDMSAPPPYPPGPPSGPPHPSFPTMNAPPPSGYRIPLGPGQPFPQGLQAGPPPFRDLDGSPVFIGSALMTNPDSVHPCKIVPGFGAGAARVPYGGTETEHRGRYDVLPFVPEQMEWVRTSGGRIPPGRRPVEGGYEDNGGHLFHAYATINGVDVPGKAGEHLGGANVPFGGAERSVRDNYHLLVWRQ